MKPSFKLDEHPRRPRPLLSDPPAGYFDQLPMRVMARLPQPTVRQANISWRWLAMLAPALRTGLASVVLLGSFAASFFLSDSQTAGPAAAATSLDAVPRAELVGYLLTSGTRVENTDLAVLTAAHPNLTTSFLHTSEAELTEALDAQPFEDLTTL